MRGRALALGAVLVLMSALGAQAQDDEDEDDYEYYFAKESSGYVELSGGFAYFDGNDAYGGGAGLTVGGHLSEYLAMDINYEYSNQSNTHFATYGFKYVVLPESRVTPFFRAGLGLMGGRPNHPFLFMGRFDGGVQIFLDEYLALKASAGFAWARDDNKISLANFGVIYYFE